MVFILLGLIFCFIYMLGCGAKTPEETFIIAQKALNSLESYSATLTYIVVENGEKREYGFKQWVSMPNRFKIQLTAPDKLVGKSITSDGRKILIEHSGLDDSVSFELESLDQQRPLFIGDFLNSFWLSEDVEKRIHIEEAIEYVILICPCMESGISTGRQELWLRSPKMIPTRMLTYDGHGNISSKILFDEFDGNWEGEQDFFELGVD